MSGASVSGGVGCMRLHTCKVLREVDMSLHAAGLASSTKVQLITVRREWFGRRQRGRQELGLVKET